MQEEEADHPLLFCHHHFKKNLRLKTQRSGNQLFVMTQIGPTAHGAGLVPLTHLLLKVVEGQTKHCF